jgi:hypothetical protein
MRHLMTVLFAFLLALPIGIAAEDKGDKPDSNPADDQVEKERATMALELCRKGANSYRLCLDDARRWS